MSAVESTRGAVLSALLLILVVLAVLLWAAETPGVPPEAFYVQCLEAGHSPEACEPLLRTIPAGDVDQAPAVSGVADRYAGARPAPRPARSARRSVWDDLADCESGVRDRHGNVVAGSARWGLNTGNGYSGGLQWAPSSWRTFKAPGDPAGAWQASREQEIAAGERYRAYEQRQGRGGFGPWPSCARRLGLPR
jgi:hypothetical protein